MRLFFRAALAAIVLVAGLIPAAAACGDPGALGVSRTMFFSGAMELGTPQYGRTLALQPMEVVLTFDDGPMPGRTDRVLAALAAACAKATFFVVGQMASAHPALLRQIAAAGHTIGTHSNSHPTMTSIGADAALRDIDRGVAAVTRVLGRPPAPYFRFPGLADRSSLRHTLASRGVSIWGADVQGDDWTGISAGTIRQRVMARLARSRGGVILLHDTKRATAAMLPQLLRDLRAGGYRLVHVVPGGFAPASDAPAVAAFDPIGAFFSSLFGPPSRQQ